MSTLYYSIAKYVNDIIRNEQINFGFAYFYPEQNSLGFIATSNTQRLLSFDDELDKDELEYLRASLQYDFSFDGLEYDDPNIIESLLNSKNGDILIFKTRNYINQIQFDSLEQTVIDKDLKTTLENLSDIFLYYDRPKKVRELDKDRIRKLTKQLIQTQVSKGAYNIEKLEKNSWNNRPFDFEVFIGTEKKFIKSLTFDYKKDPLLINQLKLYVFDLINYINKYNYNINDFVVVINNTLFEKKIEQEAKEFLTANNIKLLTLEKVSEYLKNNTFI